MKKNEESEYLDQRIGGSLIVYPKPFGIQAEYNIGKGPEFNKFSDSIEVQNLKGGLVFGYQVNDPERYGVLSFTKGGSVNGIQEKPTKPKSNYAVPGLYFFDNSVIKVASNVKPSDRGELEITDVISHYLDWGLLNVHKLPRGVAWLDTGTFESLMQAGMYVETIEQRQGIKIGCIEEIAYQNGWINRDQVLKFAQKHKKTNYGTYLTKLTKND